MNPENKHLIYRVIEYGLQHNLFTLTQLYQSLALTPEEFEMVKIHWVKMDHSEKPNQLIAIVNPVRDFYTDQRRIDEREYTLLPNAVFQYNDYLEIKAATSAAKEAKRLSIWAIIIAIIFGILQSILALIALLK